MRDINTRNKTYVGKTKYSLVYLYKDKFGDPIYEGRYNNIPRQFDDIIKAAKWVDFKLIEDNKEPRNILKRA